MLVYKITEIGSKLCKIARKNSKVQIKENKLSDNICIHKSLNQDQYIIKTIHYNIRELNQGS